MAACHISSLFAGHDKQSQQAYQAIFGSWVVIHDNCRSTCIWEVPAPFSCVSLTNGHCTTLMSQAADPAVIRLCLQLPCLE